MTSPPAALAPAPAPADAPADAAPPAGAPTAALPTPGQSPPAPAPAPAPAQTEIGLDNAEEPHAQAQAAQPLAFASGGTLRSYNPNALALGTANASASASVSAAQKNTAGYNNTMRKVNRPTTGPLAPAPATPPSAMTPATPAPPASSPQSAPPSHAFPALHLTPLNDTFVPKQISLAPAGTKVKIGRQTNAKTIPNGSNGYFDSKVLSRMHAEVWSEEGKIFIKDVKSSNGTFINGQRLSLEAAESDIFELHTEDVVEFGIDIVSDDSKTIVHHKVAAKVYLVMNQDDAAASSREFNNWYRHAGEQPLQRRGVKPPTPNSNGLSFEHVLSRLQGELQKSRDTSTNLGDLNATLNEVHDTLGGGAPSSLPPFPPPSRGGPPTASSAYGASGAKDPHAQSIAALQSQLNETQSSLAGHVGKIRDLEGLLAEHDTIKREVGTLRKQIEDAQRGMDAVMRARTAPLVVSNGRKSPVSALLEAQDDEDEDEDDARSISSVDTVRLDDSVEQRARVPNGVHPPNGLSSPLAPLSTTDVGLTLDSTKSIEALARESLLQEQNAKLAARLDSLSAELDEATRLGQALRSQHAEASSTIRALEARIQGLEKAVEGASSDAESRWTGWRDAFEEGWKQERKSWDQEREKLQGAVREWEERKRQEAESDSEWERADANNADAAGSGDEDADEQPDGRGGASVGGQSSKASKAKRPRSRRRRRSTASRVAALSAADPAQALASDSDSTIGDSTKGAAGAGPWNGPQRGGPFATHPFDEQGGPRGPGTHHTTALPMVSAGAVVILAVAAGWALSIKLKE